MDKQFTVHKSTVRALRQALVNFLYAQNKANEIPQIMRDFHDLDSYKGSRSPVKFVSKEFSQAAAFIQDDYFGLKISEYVNVSELRLYQGIKLSLQSVEAYGVEIPLIVILRLVAYYTRVMTEAVTITLIENKECIALEFKPNLPDTSDKHHMDSVVYIFHRVVEALTGFKADEILLSYRYSTGNPEIYRRTLGSYTAWSEQHTSLCYFVEKDTQSKSFFMIDQQTKSKFDEAFILSNLHNMLAEDYPHISYQAHCKHILMTILGVCHPTRENVAKVLNMSVSSFQRRLTEEGISFSQILLEIRKDLAHKYLIENKLPASNVAFLLGYNSSSQFFTAFKSWYSITPKQYQQKHLAA